MKRYLWLCVLILLAGHVPTVSADAACESRFVNPGYLLELHLSAVAGQYKSESGKAAGYGQSLNAAPVLSGAAAHF